MMVIVFGVFDLPVAISKIYTQVFKNIQNTKVLQMGDN